MAWDKSTASGETFYVCGKKPDYAAKCVSKVFKLRCVEGKTYVACSYCGAHVEDPAFFKGMDDAAFAAEVISLKVEPKAKNKPSKTALVNKKLKEAAAALKKKAKKK